MIYLSINTVGDKYFLMTGLYLPEKFPLEGSTSVVSPRNIPPMKSMHGNNVVWLCAKYAVDANLFRLESSILTYKPEQHQGRGGSFLGEIYWGGTFREGVYLEPVF